MRSPDLPDRPTSRLFAPLSPGLSDLADAVGARIPAAVADGSGRLGVAH